MKELSKKAKNMSASVTLELTAKAGEMRKAGIDVISFGVGEPDFNTPKNIINAAKMAMDAGKNKYTAASGMIELKTAICGKFKNDNNLNFEESNIVVSTGAKQSLANSFLAILNPFDEVIMAVPYWVSYPELIKLADGVPILVKTSEKTDFKLTSKDIKDNLTNKTKAIIINSPNNPTGAIYTKEELEDIAKVCEELDLFIISDEIYEKLNYDNQNNPHISIASISDDAFNRTIVINGFSKSHAMTGWRLGYCGANKEITKIMATIQSHTTSNPNTIAQYAGLEALIGEDEELNKMVEIFEKRRNLMVKHLKNIKDITYITPKGAFYCFINVSNLFNDEIKSSSEFTNKLLENENVMLIPGIAFGNDDYIRLSYATSEENIVKGMNRIETFVKAMR